MNNPQENKSDALQRVLKREVVGRKFDDLLYSLLEEYNELEKELAKRDEALREARSIIYSITFQPTRLVGPANDWLKKYSGDK